MSPLTASVFLLMAACAALHGAGSHASTQPLTAGPGQIAEVLGDAPGWRGVKRWRIDYEVMSKGSATHRIMAVGTPGEMYTLSAHFTRAYPWQEDPYAQESFIHRGIGCHRWPFSRTFSELVMTRGQAIPGSFQEDVLLPVMPGWPVRDYALPVGAVSQAVLPILPALDTGRYSVLPGRKVIAGEPCAVLDRPDSDRIWIALGKGGCIMRRQFWDPRYQRPRERVLTEKIAQVGPGLWLPVDFRTQLLSLIPGTNGEPRILLEFTVRILRCALNDEVAASTFAPVYAPGSLRYSKGDQFTQFLPGGESLLSDISRFLSRRMGLPTKPRREPLFVFGGLGILLGFCVGASAFQKWSGWRASAVPCRGGEEAQVGGEPCPRAGHRGS
jgi:hypothetical protein